MSAQGRSRDRTNEDNLGSPWWIVAGASITMAMTWVAVMWIDVFTEEFPENCVRGPRGGCMSSNVSWVPEVAVFVLAVPWMVVTITGLAADRWPPALGLAIGCMSGGIYVLAHAQTAAHVTLAAMLFAAAVTALSLTWHRKGKATPTTRSWLSP
ncbi:hypothetical protein ACFYU9_05270 [Streptomyces sp. NPDC004327]|uniref:hypothetical protein n=1 Tax=Streptomyces sp. NPDC004327 TaxID=3364699 RepID=UPI00368B9A9E